MDFTSTDLVSVTDVLRWTKRDARITHKTTHVCICIRSRVHLSDLIVIQDAHIFLWDVPHNHEYIYSTYTHANVRH